MTIDTSSFFDYQRKRRDHWDEYAEFVKQKKGWGSYYHQRLGQIYRLIIPAKEKILEIGCGNGDLLAILKPTFGVGIDLSEKMIKLAQRRHPDLCFIQGDAHTLNLKDKFDHIIISDTINDLWDIQTVLDKLNNVCTPSTRLIINSYSRLWEIPLNIARGMKLATPNLNQNWVTVEDINNLLKLTSFETIRSWSEIILPINIPILAPLFNKFLVRLWPFNHLALSNFIIARPVSSIQEQQHLEPVVSVIVPARNEAGNIRNIFEQVPEMGQYTELIFVEGNSKDDTYETIQELISKYPQRKAALIKQTGVGKGDAVRSGFEQSCGQVLMILDADLTVPPEYLPRFYRALLQNKGEFINGVRLVYPMEKKAMRFFNLLGNKFFSLVFSWLIGQPVKDTLCGTKVVWKQDYERIAANRSYFGEFDPFGDFDLLFGAAKLNQKIIDMPIRYKERVYGETNIQRWKHGLLLIRMVMFAARRLKFI